jgi:hypothetical protein
MSVIPTISADGVGVGVVAAGQLNAYVISAYNVGTLRSITGQTGMTAILQGIMAKPGLYANINAKRNRIRNKTWQEIKKG